MADRVPVFVPIHKALIWAAAQRKVVHNDDTSMKVLNLAALNEPDKLDSGEQITTFFCELIAIKPQDFNRLPPTPILVLPYSNTSLKDIPGPVFFNLLKKGG